MVPPDRSPVAEHTGAMDILLLLGFALAVIGLLVILTVLPGGAVLGLVALLAGFALAVLGSGRVRRR